jgi:hypothetical protein
MLARVWALLIVAAEAVLLFEPFTLQLSNASVPAPATPFNSSSLGTTFVFTAPSGRTYSVLPFFTQDFSRSHDARGDELLQPNGAPYFAVRYAPSELGLHTYVQVFAAPPAGGAAPLSGNLTAEGGPVIPGDNYVAVKNNKFTLDNRTAFWLVGENMAWPGCWPYFNGSAAFDNATGASYMYDRFLPKLAAAGGNWIRLWVGPSLVRDVSWQGEEGSFLSVALASKVAFGAYNLEAAWRIEHIVDLCRSLGIKISLVLEAQQAVSFYSLAAPKKSPAHPLPARTPGVRGPVGFLGRGHLQRRKRRAPLWRRGPRLFLQRHHGGAAAEVDVHCVPVGAQHVHFLLGAPKRGGGLARGLRRGCAGGVL